MATLRFRRGRPVPCEICGSLVQVGGQRCPYCEAPLPPAGFVAKHMWEIGGALAGALFGPFLVFAALSIGPHPPRHLAFIGFGLIAFAAVVSIVVGALLGVLWGYRMRKGRGQLYRDWDRRF